MLLEHIMQMSLLCVHITAMLLTGVTHHCVYHMLLLYVHHVAAMCTIWLYVYLSLPDTAVCVRHYTVYILCHFCECSMSLLRMYMSLLCTQHVTAMYVHVTAMYTACHCYVGLLGVFFPVFFGCRLCSNSAKSSVVNDWKKKKRSLIIFIILTCTHRQTIAHSTFRTLL